MLASKTSITSPLLHLFVCPRKLGRNAGGYRIVREFDQFLVREYHNFHIIMSMGVLYLRRFHNINPEGLRQVLSLDPPWH